MVEHSTKRPPRVVLSDVLQLLLLESKLRSQFPTSFTWVAWSFEAEGSSVQFSSATEVAAALSEQLK